MKEKVIFTVSIFILFSTAVYCQDYNSTDTLSTLKHHLKSLKLKSTSLKKAKQSISDSLSIINNKIEHIKMVISNAEINKFKNTKTILELSSDATLYNKKSVLLAKKLAHLKKGQKVIFEKIAGNEFFKVKYQDKVGYILNNQFKNGKTMKRLRSMIRTQEKRRKAQAKKRKPRQKEEQHI